jgi:hypothetical protein
MIGSAHTITVLRNWNDALSTAIDWFRNNGAPVAKDLDDPTIEVAGVSRKQQQQIANATFYQRFYQCVASPPPATNLP